MEKVDLRIDQSMILAQDDLAITIMTFLPRTSSYMNFLIKAYLRCLLIAGREKYIGWRPFTPNSCGFALFGDRP